MDKSTKNSATKDAAAPTKPSNEGKRGADDTIRNDNLKKRKTRKTFIKEKDDEYMDEQELKLSGALIMVESHSKASKEDGGGKEASTEEEPSKMQVVEESVTIPEESNSSEEISSEEDIAASSDETESVTISEDIAVSSDEAEDIDVKSTDVSTKATEMDIAPKELLGSSKTLFVGNLSFSVEQADVKDFFKVAGDIVGVRLAMGPDRSFRGFAHVEFTTAEVAVKALNELNGLALAGRPVRLELAKERDSQSFRKGGGATRQTIFVCGFNRYTGEVQIGSALRDHFGSCGEITRVSLPRDKYGGIMGMAYIDFKNHDAYNQALKFNGSVFGENTLTVEVADPGDGGFDSGRRGGQQNGRQGSGGRFIGHQHGGRTRQRRFSGSGHGHGRGRGRQATPGHS